MDFGLGVSVELLSRLNSFYSSVCLSRIIAVFAPMASYRSQCRPVPFQAADRTDTVDELLNRQMTYKHVR